ncbi:MAG: C4-dicarboxylate TRAP transporter substrate-binding protein [Rhodospirillaceae bacterium]|mgnify:CR=1 FL=1|jgi:C4-dicarboxylate-binding protein DctP|nr:C4-dicarboxylate TRAP transporter substrate-binding protein [Rhodospirillaceae bacterium]MBT5051350.1 C4-dicarboxylate TRAP transporter substrate-binding protein [Rhodospirillaceae bacterium]MBT5459021.1 C4-dicarboxylate TRAP transporter substrate-binding protein [Rhodospirillaceae bacterium]
MAVTFNSITKAAGAGAAVALCLTALNSTAHAQKTISLTAIDGYPAKALWVKTFVKFFVPEVNRQLATTGNYKIKWNLAWGGQIVKPKGVFKGLQKGLGDLGIVTTVFHADKVPLHGLSFATPFVTTDPALLARTFDDMAQKFPAFKEGWKKYNQVYLTNLAVLDSYNMFFKEPVKGLSSFKGKKIAAAGLNMRYLKNTGAAGVGGSLVSYYNKLKTGVVDGAMIWAEAAVIFRTVEVAPYMLRASIGTVNSKAITVNAKTWKRLPNEVRGVLKKAALFYRDQTSKTVFGRSKVMYKKFAKKGGKITEMSDAQRKAWANGMPNVAKGWAASLEKKGIPGKKILSYYMDRMRANNQPILRQWDKE